MSYSYFTLHNLNILQASLSDIDKEDPQKLQKTYKLQTHKLRAIPTTVWLLPNVSGEYPWGTFLTIKWLKQLLKCEPSQLLHDPDTEGEEPQAPELFKIVYLLQPANLDAFGRRKSVMETNSQF